MDALPREFHSSVTNLSFLYFFDRFFSYSVSADSTKVTFNAFSKPFTSAWQASVVEKFEPSSCRAEVSFLLDTFSTSLRVFAHGTFRYVNIFVWSMSIMNVPCWSSMPFFAVCAFPEIFFPLMVRLGHRFGCGGLYSALVPRSITASLSPLHIFWYALSMSRSLHPRSLSLAAMLYVSSPSESWYTAPPPLILRTMSTPSFLQLSTKISSVRVWKRPMETAEGLHWYNLRVLGTLFSVLAFIIASSTAMFVYASEVSSVSSLQVSICFSL